MGQGRGLHRASEVRDERLVRGEVMNQITVDEHTTEWARVALQRMLDIT